MIAEINISLFVFTIILISITWQNVPHHIHSEAALLIGDDYRVTHMIVFFIESTTDIYLLPIVHETKNSLRCTHLSSRVINILDYGLSMLYGNRIIKVCGEYYCTQYNGKDTCIHCYVSIVLE